MTHPETLNQVLAKLEPDSGFDGCRHHATYTPERQAMLSLAISAKRIADALEANLSAGGFANLEHLAFRMGESFELGRRQA